MREYIELFVDEIYPEFIDKYLNTKTLNRLRYVTQFCGCDYTTLYNPKFLYTRFAHSLVVAHMTWHFTHDKKETIAALLHDVGTPCFAHCIDYVFGDYLNQESSEKDIVDVLHEDKVILEYLNEDGINLDDLKSFSNYAILENKSPKLCTDRLDGVLHTCYVWLQTHELKEIKEVYDNLDVLENEDGDKELGFKNLNIAEKFSSMVLAYAKELQGNKDKYVMKYISEVVKASVKKNLITLEDLYSKTENEIIKIFSANFKSWKTFTISKSLINTDNEPSNFHISFETKKRNVIPLVSFENATKRLIDISEKGKSDYLEFQNFTDTKYAYIESILVID